MTPVDASALLLAVAGTTVAKDSQRPVNRHGRMQSSNGAWALDFLPIPELRSLPPEHTLRDALEALITSAMNGSLQRTVESVAGPTDISHDQNLPFAIEVDILEPNTWSSIQIMTLVPDEEGLVQIDQREQKNYSKARKTGRGNISYDPPLDLSMYGDLTHRHRFSQRTIISIAELLRS